MPFEHHQKRPFDKLTDILLQIPGIYLLRNSMRLDREYNGKPLEPSRQAVEDKAAHMISWLARFWEECGDTINYGYDYSRFLESTGFQADAKNWIVEEIMPAYFQDTFAATSIALYDAGTIIANALAWESASSKSDTNQQRIVIHCESVLSTVAYHESKGPRSGGTLAMIFPLKIVCRVTPSDHQRQRASNALHKWGSSRGVGGICGFVGPEKRDIYSVIREMEKTRATNNLFESRNLSRDSSLDPSNVPQFLRENGPTLQNTTHAEVSA